jgi:hypothetical protein
LMALSDQVSCDMESNEACRAGDEKSHLRLKNFLSDVA